MKKLITLSLLFTLGLSGCIKYDDDYGDIMPYLEYEPVIVDRGTLDSMIHFTSSVPITNPSKIYLHNQYIFIIEKYEGIHIINNTNPYTPKNIGFIKVPGCVDVAAKNDIIYADNATDLVAIRWEDKECKVLKRIPNLFKELMPPGHDQLPYEYNVENRPKNTVIISWKKI